MALFAREQQGVNWSCFAFSSSVKYMSRWSHWPSSTRVMQVPHTPCSQEVRISMPCAASACTTVWPAGTRTTWPLLAIFRFLPLGLRDWCYDRVALNRYRLFGRYDACLLPSPDHEGRFLNADR